MPRQHRAEDVDGGKAGVSDSQALAGPIRSVLYGRRGYPLLYLPSSGGDESEFAAYGMPEICRPWIDAGRVQVLAVDAGGPHSLWNEALEPRARMATYAACERSVGSDVIPEFLRLTGSASLGLIGASYGAFMAANLLLKRPGPVDLVCGLGGVYGLWHRLDGYSDDTVYFHTPLEFLPGLNDETILAGIRGTRGLDLFAAEADEWLGSSLRLAEQLEGKQLPHVLEVWPAPADHHERWWRPQLERFLTRRFPLADAAGETLP